MNPVAIVLGVRVSYGNQYPAIERSLGPGRIPMGLGTEGCCAERGDERVTCLRSKGWLVGGERCCAYGKAWLSREDSRWCVSHSPLVAASIVAVNGLLTYHRANRIWKWGSTYKQPFWCSNHLKIQWNPSENSPEPMSFEYIPGRRYGWSNLWIEGSGESLNPKHCC